MTAADPTHAGTASPPRIVFAVMSAVAPVATVDQLARALAPHTVLVHHDFSQQPAFAPSAPNLRFVPDPVRTGWGVFGFVDGIFHTLRHAVGELDFDYLQLLSPSCLPIKPMQQFEAHVAGGAEAHFDCIDVLADTDALMSVGYRAFTPEQTLRHRLARRLTWAYFGREHGRRDEAGIWLRSGGRAGLVPKVAHGFMRALSRPALGRHPFDESFRPYYGSTWFGARKRVLRSMLDGFDRQGVRAYFSRLRIAEEFLVPTLLMQAGGARGSMNHYIHRFEEAHPGNLQDEHFDMLQAHPAFFARKFAAAAETPLRARVLEELCRGDAAMPAPRRPPRAQPATTADPLPAGLASTVARVLPGTGAGLGVRAKAGRA